VRPLYLHLLGCIQCTRVCQVFRSTGCSGAKQREAKTQGKQTCHPADDVFTPLFPFVPYLVGVSLSLHQFIEHYIAQRNAALDAIKHQPTLLFIGAGVGADIYPLWSSLLGRLLEAAELTLTAEQNSWTPPEIAQHIKDSNEEVYFRIIREVFQSYEPTIEKVIYDIRDLPIKSIITTNYDNALDEALVEEGFTTVTIDGLHPTILNDDVKHIFHIHGFIHSDMLDSEPLQIILSTDEYDKFYKKEPIVSEFLRAALRNFNIIFIGFSLADPYVMNIVGEINRLEKSQIKRGLPYRLMNRYALCELEVTNISGRRVLDWDQIEDKEHDLLQYGITPIWYEKETKYRGLNKLIQSWVSQSRPVFENIAETAPEKP
jgi:SIR2-like domain